MYDPLAHDPRDRMVFVLHATPARRFALAVARLVLAPFMALRTLGLEHLPPQGAFVLASNHVSNWDVFAMQLSLPRTIFFMSKAELFQFAPLGNVLRDFGAFPVYRGGKDAWALRHAQRVLAAGQVLGMFPEGHRSKGRGLLPARTGAARIALDARCAILPLAISGTQHIVRSLPRRALVSVQVLDPLYAGLDESAEQLTERLMWAIASALPEDQRGAYARPGSR